MAPSDGERAEGGLAQDGSSRDNIADILCIGCQKGSTSWLHSVLATHPRTWSFPDSEPVTSTDKEAHFWDWNRKRGISWYHELLTPPDPSLKSMDFTPEYAYLSPSQIRECAQINPSAKVIYILRDPLTRAISALRMYLLWKHGKEWRGSVALNDEFYALVEQARLDVHGDYMANLRRWKHAYPDMIVLNYEDFHKDRAAKVDEVMDRLGLDRSLLDTARREKLEKLMSVKIWQSEPFALERPALMFLEGMVQGWRAETEDELGFSFREGAEMLAGS